MIILSIETSCDETAISLVNADASGSQPVFSVLGNVVLSQAAKHAEFGGVFPNLAKREHAAHITTVLEQVLKQADMIRPGTTQIDTDTIHALLEREPDLEQKFLDLVNHIHQPNIDHIVVTAGPGLEPALWVGINFAKALGIAWDIPVWPANHMEGHILSVLAPNQSGSQITLSDIQFPVLSLLISGGHTELVLMKDWFEYEVIGETRDDAVGEAFDKTARLLGLPYPGGPEISKLALEGNANVDISLPRPMIHTDDFDFSFSGIKTAVRYLVQSLSDPLPLAKGEVPKAEGVFLDHQTKADIAREFEHAVTEVLIKKTMRAIEQFGVQSLIIAGGVSANTFIRKAFETACTNNGVSLLVPEFTLSTDNSLMIAIAGYFQIVRNKKAPDAGSIRAEGNLGF